jgi:GT2 family glycosyltransferase
LNNASVVVVHRNRPVECAESVLRFASCPAVSAVTVVDNASGSAERADLVSRCRGIDRVATLLLPENRGYAGAVREAVARDVASDQEVLVVAAQDAMAEETTVPSLLAALTRHQADVAFATTPPPRIGDWSPWRGASTLGASASRPSHAADVLYVATPCFAVRGTAARRGLLPDGALFLYLEECELGLRARRAGCRVVAAFDAVVRNASVGGTTRGPIAAYLLARNGVLLSRWYGSPWSAVLLAARYSTSGLRDSLSRRGPCFGTARTLGALAGLAGLTGRPAWPGPWFDCLRPGRGGPA